MGVATDITSALAHLPLAILLLPFFSFCLLFFLGHYLPRKGDWIATLIAAVNFLLSLYLFWVSCIKNITIHPRPITWVELGEKKFTVSLLINPHAAIMLLLVTFIAFLVHLYSLEYMKGKRNYIRYYPYLGIFTFSMIGIVISDNLLITFMFWELVGFSSYLLIGFWYEKEAAVTAAKKAFLFNRIGDTGFIIAILILYGLFDTLEISSIENSIRTSPGLYNFEWLFWLGLGIFMGCIGKSAQFPLQAWLPDAMEGPTPVSALIHAATMVAAGVYLLIKIHFLLTVDVLTVIAVIGALTAFMGALPALFQNDIKKVLAYSTISQLGYMIMAVGVDAHHASFFHLITHGFFKACLFLSAGAVIHAMHEVKHELFIQGKYRDFDSQDMRWMGGFRSKMKLTFVCYVVSALALVGIPLFSGFLSKDAILEGTVEWATSKGTLIAYVVPLLAYGTVFITAVYMIRQLILIFMGEFRLEQKLPVSKEVVDHIKDSSLLMTGPLLVLAAFCFWFFFSPNPFTAENGYIFHTKPMHVLTAVLSVLLSIGGLVVGYFLFSKKPVVVPFENENHDVELEKPKGLLANNWYLDRIYYYVLVIPGLKTARLFSKTDGKVIDGCIHFFAIAYVVFGHIVAWFDKYVVDGVVNSGATIAYKIGALARGLQSGKVQGYIVLTLLTLIILLVWIIIA